MPTDPNPSDTSLSNRPLQSSSPSAMTDVPGAAVPPKGDPKPKEGPIKKLQYDPDKGLQLSVNTNLGAFVLGEVKSVGPAEASQDDARMLINNGQFIDPGDDAEPGISEEQQKKNAEEAKKRDRELADMHARASATPAPLTSQQIAANAAAQQQADQAASNTKSGRKS